MAEPIVRKPAFVLQETDKKNGKVDVYFVDRGCKTAPKFEDLKPTYKECTVEKTKITCPPSNGNGSDTPFSIVNDNKVLFNITVDNVKSEFYVPFQWRAAVAATPVPKPTDGATSGAAEGETAPPFEANVTKVIALVQQPKKDEKDLRYLPYVMTEADLSVKGAEETIKGLCAGTYYEPETFEEKVAAKATSDAKYALGNFLCNRLGNFAGMSPIEFEAAMKKIDPRYNATTSAVIIDAYCRGTVDEKGVVTPAKLANDVEVDVELLDAVPVAPAATTTTTAPAGEAARSITSATFVGKKNRSPYIDNSLTVKVSGLKEKDVVIIHVGDFKFEKLVSSKDMVVVFSKGDGKKLASNIGAGSKAVSLEYNGVKTPVTGPDGQPLQITVGKQPKAPAANAGSADPYRGTTSR